MSQVLRVITFNVAGARDTQRLIKLAGKGDVDESTAGAWYQDRVKEGVIDGKIYSHEADILCLQELHGDAPEKAELNKRITDAGFTILGQGDLAIAYKTNRFTLINGKYGYTEGEAFYAHLRDKITQQVICVVTDHVTGFDSRLQKIYTQALRPQINVDGINPFTKKPWQGVEKKGVEGEKKKEPATGDKKLALSLQAIGQDADLIVYGLDANTTAKYIPDPRLHPKRLKQFFDAGYICDTADKAPTIVDHNLDQRHVCKDKVPTTEVQLCGRYNQEANVPMKFDYVFVKPRAGLEISITSQALGPSPLEFAKLLSDHRPVYAEIRLPSRGIVYRFFSAIFNGFMHFISFLGRLPRIFWSLFTRDNMKQFDAHFKKDSNYAYLKTHAGNNFGLLLAAKISPEELAGYFTMENSENEKMTLEELLAAKNSHDTQERFHDKPAQICEFFIVWCVLKKLQGESWKIKFETFEEFRKTLRTNLKKGLEKLRDNPSTPVEQKCAAYIKQHMQSANLLRPVG